MAAAGCGSGGDAGAPTPTTAGATTTLPAATTTEPGAVAPLEEWARALPDGSCALVQSADGAVLLDVAGATPLPPASTIKLFVAAAALQALGPETVVEGDLVGDLVGRMLAGSDNAAAAAVASAMGGGDGAAGLAVISDTLDGLGFRAPAVVVGDATGHSAGNRITCQALVELLRDPALGPQIEPALAVAGRTGTLADAFTEEPFAGLMKAKTGSLSTVSALAGVVDGPGGRFHFAVVLSDPAGVDASAAATVQAALGRILVGSGVL